MTTAGAEVPARDEQARSRRRTQLVAAGLALITVLALGAWVLHRIAYVHVSDARIAATMIMLASRSEGWVAGIEVAEGQRVQAGDLLLRIDDREARHVLAEREAAVRRLEAERSTLELRKAMIDALTRSRLDSRQSELEAAQAALRAAEAEYERAEAEWRRATPMLEREIISRQLWERQRNDYQQADSALESARASLARARSTLAEAEAERGELRLIEAELAASIHALAEARAQRDRQQIVVDDHSLRAPEAGVIDEVFIERGEHVRPGQRLLMLHDPDVVWVSANVRETELRHFGPGSRARVRVDAFPGQPLGGRVSRVGTAATSEFALLPAPNPSGNFTKITQRVKIRIDLDDTAGLDLRPGMMVEVAIDK